MKRINSCFIFSLNPQQTTTKTTYSHINSILIVYERGTRKGREIERDWDVERSFAEKLRALLEICLTIAFVLAFLLRETQGKASSKRNEKYSIFVLQKYGDYDYINVAIVLIQIKRFIHSQSDGNSIWVYEIYVFNTITCISFLRLS